MRVRLTVTAISAAVAIAACFPATGTAASITAADRDCPDFSTQAQAQSYFIDRGGPSSDPDRLDADGDGVACESNPCPCSSATSKKKKKPKPKPKPLVFGARILDVVDGDTIRVRHLITDKVYTVRLLGIDTPESKKPGVAVECGAREATSNMLRLGFTEPMDSDGDGLLDKRGGDGRKVKLTTDATQDKFDSFKRLLAYADTSDGQLNVTQVAAGWAKVYTFKKRVRQYDRFAAAQARAKADDRGVWSQCGGDFHSEQR
jgi:endonuclease YncB( thermonuclease family)